MTTVHPAWDDAATIAEAVLTLARDARRALPSAAAGPYGRGGDVLPELHHRAETLRSRIGPDRLQGARRWLEALQALISAHQAAVELRGPAARPDAPAVRMAG
jgi:hypothetical protein